MKASLADRARVFVRNPRRVALRWWLFYAHLISGVGLGLYFVLIGLTGSIIVFEPELNRLTMPPATVRSGEAPTLPLSQVLQRIESAYPEHRVSFIRWYPEPADRYRVRLKRRAGDGIDTYAYVDRATGESLGTSPPWIRWMMDLHIYLLAGDTGLKVNGIGALLLGVVSLTGLVVWWPGIRQWARGFKINTRANWRGLNYDTHRVVGIVSLVPLAIFAFSGFYFGFPEPFRRAVDYRVIPSSVVRTGLPPVNLEALVMRANDALPGGMVTVLYPPGSPTDVYRFRVKLPGDSWEFGRSEVYLDQYGGEVRGVHDVRALTLSQLVLVQWMVPVHYGRFGGLATRILWVLAGLTPLALFVSGCLMWWNRSLSKGWRRRRTAAAAPSYQPDLYQHPSRSR